LDGARRGVGGKETGLRSSERRAGVKESEVESGGRDSPTLGPTIGKARGLDEWGSGDEKLTIKPDGQISNALSEYLPQYCKDLLHVVSRNDRTLPGEVSTLDPDTLIKMDNKFLDSRKWAKTTDPIADLTVGDSKLHSTAPMNEMNSYEATKIGQDDAKATIKNVKTASQIYNKMTQ
jgi:hypothetical protein